MKKVKLIAVLAAAVAGLSLFLFLQEATKPVETPLNTVVVAAVDIRENAIITGEMLKYVKVPPESILSGAASSTEDVIGKVANSMILAGEQIRVGRLVDLVSTDNVNSLAYTVPEGMRAVTVAVTPTSGVAGMLLPGNRADVILLYEVEIQTAGQIEKKMTARILMQNINILAIDQILDKNGSGENGAMYTNVTLEVTPKQAVELSLAQNVGQLSFALRSPIDEKLVDAGVISTDILDNGQ